MRLRFPILIAATVLAGCSTSPQPVTGVIMTKVKWPELEKAIAAHRGKIVVIDVWAEY